jgi:hypothetical protein
MGEGCCFIHPQDTFNKIRIMYVFPYKPFTVLEMRTRVMRHEALDLHVMLWVQVMVLEG